MRRALSGPPRWAAMSCGVIAGLSLAACAAPGGGAPMRLADAQTLAGDTDFLALSPFGENGDVRAVIEIPAGTLAKWEISKDAPNTIRWEIRDGAPRVVAYLAYPANYGVIPGTLLPKSAGGDGDPLDVLVLGDTLARGQVINVRLVGLLRMIDAGEQDDKLIAVPLQGSPFSHVRDMAELEQDFPGAARILEIWFDNYKGPGNTVDLNGFEGPERAAAMLAQAARSRAGL